MDLFPLKPARLLLKSTFYPKKKSLRAGKKYMEWVCSLFACLGFFFPVSVSSLETGVSPRL